MCLQVNLFTDLASLCISMLADRGAALIAAITENIKQIVLKVDISRLV